MGKDRDKELPQRKPGDTLPPEEAMALIINREEAKIRREGNGDWS